MLTLWSQTLGLRPVLACADSNVAIDNIGVALVAAGISVCRLGGRAEAIRPELQPFMADALGGVQAGIAQSDVVLATCVGSGADSLSKISFEAVLIDETAQVT